MPPNPDSDPIQIHYVSLKKDLTAIENVVVQSSCWRETDLPLLFGDEPVHLTACTELSRLMVELGAYPSTSKARKAGRVGPIPFGWTEYKASKKRRLWIWSPSE